MTDHVLEYERQVSELENAIRINTPPAPAAIDAHPIPPMTDPLGRSWSQPPRERVLVDDTHAAMTPTDFRSLAEYSTSYPSGIYPGKMWRAEEWRWENGSRVPTGRHFLRWYGIVPGNPKVCSNNQREILLA